MQLRGRVVLITGATGGIGTATAHAVHEAGGQVVVAGRDRARCAALAAELGGVAVPGDLAVPGGPAELIDAARRVAPIDVLVANAGTGLAAPLTQTPAAKIPELLRINLEVPIELTRLVLPEFLERGHGRIVLVGSIAGLLGVRDESVYAATKAGVAGFAASLADELAHTGVGVTLVAPGAVDTGFFLRRGRGYDRGFPPPIRPERVAAAIVRAVRADRDRVVVPGWMQLPARLAGAAPGVYRKLSARFG